MGDDKSTEIDNNQIERHFCYQNPTPWIEDSFIMAPNYAELIKRNE